MAVLKASMIATLVASLGAVGVYKATARDAPPPPKGAHMPTRSEMYASATALVGKSTACRGAVRTPECAVTRVRVDAQIADAFDAVSATPDTTLGKEAGRALHERDIHTQLAALNYLGRLSPAEFDRTALADVLGLLEYSRSLPVGERAAGLLGAQHPAWAAVARRYEENHKTFTHDRKNLAYWRAVDVPSTASLGVPFYPSVTAYAPADTDRSIGWITKATPAQVVAWFTTSLGAAPVATTPETWQQFLMTTLQRETTVAGGISTADVMEIQRLQQEFRKTHDQKLLAQIQVISKRIEAAASGKAGPPKTPTGVAVQGQVTGAYLRHVGDTTPVTAFVGAKQPDRIVAMVFVYPEPSLGGTIIEYAWSLTDLAPLAAATP